MPTFLIYISTNECKIGSSNHTATINSITNFTNWGGIWYATQIYEYRCGRNKIKDFLRAWVDFLFSFYLCVLLWIKTFFKVYLFIYLLKVWLKNPLLVILITDIAFNYVRFSGNIKEGKDFLIFHFIIKLLKKLNIN